MSKKASKAKPPKRSVDDVVLIAPSPREDFGVELHAKGAIASARTSLKNLQEEWGTVTQQVIILLDKTEQTTQSSGFRLDEVSVELGINAKGQIGFIVGGEVGGEASITLTFKRK